MHVSRQLSLFYLSHTWLFGTSCYIFSRLTAFRMPRFADVMLFLAADRADERLEAVTYLVPSLDNRNRPLSRTDCPVRQDEGVFEQRVEPGPPHGGYCSHVCRSPSCRQKALHVLDAECGNAKQMISVGASHNTCHLFTGKITTEGERWIVSGIFYT